MKPTISIENFAWQPGIGSNSHSLARMVAEFRKPSYSMGEAWFMGPQRKMYPELHEDLKLLTPAQLMWPFYDLISGPFCFGNHDEWTEWYHYLLPQLLLRGHEASCGESLLELLIGAFIAQHPDGVRRPPYYEFELDALLTVGTAIMNPSWWKFKSSDGSPQSEPCFSPPSVSAVAPVSGAFSSSMFFCVKYLPTDVVSEWAKSLFVIDCPNWRANLVKWLAAAKDLLTGKIMYPSHFDGQTTEALEWGWSHAISPLYDQTNTSQDEFPNAFVNPENCAALISVIKSVVTTDLLLAWLDDFERHDHLRDLGPTISRLDRLY